jgi:hypothetical protein
MDAFRTLVYFAKYIITLVNPTINLYLLTMLARIIHGACAVIRPAIKRKSI